MFEKGPKDESTLKNYVDRFHDSEKAVTAAENTKRELEKRIEELTALVNGNYGPDNAFYALKGQCFHFDTNE